MSTNRDCRGSTGISHLTLRVALAIAAGIALGNVAFGILEGITRLAVGATSIPITIGLILVMFSPLAKVRCEILGEVFRNTPVLVAGAILVFAASRDAFSQGDPLEGAGRAADVPTAGARRRYRPCEVVAESIFGSGEDEPFTPLLLRTLFTDGWGDPWIAPPSDSDMPVRQGWVNAPDGLFFRNLVWTYQNIADIPGDRSANLGMFQFQSPLSRRLWISLDVPYVTTLSGTPNAASFGDFNVGMRVMLRETRRVSIIAGLATRTPTGQLSTLNGLARLNPNLQFWAHLTGRWSMRGGAGVDVPLNDFDVLPTNFLTNIAIGETITGHDVPIFGDFQYYLVANLRNNLSSMSVPTFFSLTPGFRMHLGGEYYLAGGIEFPLTQPHPYGDRLTFFFVKGF